MKRKRTKKALTGLRSQSQHQERRTEAGTKEALVQARTEMEDRLRGAHQRSQAAARIAAMPLQRRRRNQALGGARSDRRQPHPYRRCPGRRLISKNRKNEVA